jgi:Mg2+ and Co2+ transporter CorA
VSSSLQLLGSSTTGIGGIQQSFTALTDPITGTIASQNSQWAATLQKLTDQISTKTTQIQAMEQTLNQRLQAADASVANLASQQNILTASITSLNYTSYGYNSNISTSKST